MDPQGALLLFSEICVQVLLGGSQPVCSCPRGPYRSVYTTVDTHICVHMYIYIYLLHTGAKINYHCVISWFLSSCKTGMASQSLSP